MNRLYKIFIMIFLINVITQFSEYSYINYAVHAGEDRYSFSKLRLSGYGTISNTFDDRNDMAPMRDVSKNSININDYDKNSTWRLDSRLGLHADYQFSQNFEWIIQGVLRDHADTSFESSIELAYLGFKPLPLLNFRVGRIGYDAFLMSDIRNTGYAYMWVRPPIEFYALVPIFSVNGADAALSIGQGDVQWRIKAQGGKSNFAIDMDTNIHDFEVGNLWGLTIMRQSGPLQIKAGYSQCTSLNEFKKLELLHTGLEAIAEVSDNLSFPDIKKEALSLRNELTFANNDVSYITLGTTYDDGTFIAQAEIAKITTTKDFLPNGDMGYLSIGYRVANFTPYSTFSIIEPGTSPYQTVSNWNSLPSVFGDAESFHSLAIEVLNSTRAEQYTYSLGLRWDFNNQAALKLQWDNSHIQTYGYGLWLWHGETFIHKSTINTYTLGMEFVF